MKKHLSRQDFLKLAGVLPLSVAAPGLLEMASRAQPLQSTQQNVIVVIYDAFSAYHLSFLGYGRETTPHLAKFANAQLYTVSTTLGEISLLLELDF